MRSVRALDNVSFTDWFKSHGGSEGSIRRMWDPIAYALGFLNCDQVGVTPLFCNQETFCRVVYVLDC